MALSFKLILRNELFSMSLRFYEAASGGLDGHLALIHYTLYFDRKSPQEIYNVTQLPDTIRKPSSVHGLI